MKRYLYIYSYTNTDTDTDTDTYVDTDTDTEIDTDTHAYPYDCSDAENCLAIGLRKYTKNTDDSKLWQECQVV